MKDGKISLNRGFVLAGLTEKRLPRSKSRTVDPDSFEPTAEELVERLAAAVDPEPVEKVTRNDSRPAEDLDPISIVTPPEKSEFYLCRISRHCVWPPPSPLFLMDKSEPKPTPDTIQFANAPVVTLRTEFRDVQAKHAVAPIAFRETQRDFKRYAAVIAATSVEDVKVGDGEAFRTCGFPASRLSDQGPFMLSPTGGCSLSFPIGPTRVSRRDTRRGRRRCQLPGVGVWRTTTVAADIGNGHPPRGRLC